MRNMGVCLFGSARIVETVTCSPPTATPAARRCSTGDQRPFAKLGLPEIVQLDWPTASLRTDQSERPSPGVGLVCRRSINAISFRPLTMCTLQMGQSKEPLPPPAELAGAFARIEQAVQDHVRLQRETRAFLYDYFKRMIKELDPETGNFAVQLRHPRESIVTGAPQVLVGQIIENLRSALDYVVFELSAKNVPDLNERTPQFVIADSETEYQRAARRRLRYLTDEENTLVERLQPYNGNEMLKLMAEMVGEGKHRRLLSIRENNSFDMYLDQVCNKGQYDNCFAYPLEEGNAVFVRLKREPLVLLMDKYDAVPMLGAMIKHVTDVVSASRCFFGGNHSA